MDNWTSLVQLLVPKDGVDITTDPKLWDESNPAYKEILKKWQDAQFNLASIKWTNYYPGLHFQSELVNQLVIDLKLSGLHRAWVSRVDPGFMTGWHWDVDDNEEQYLEKGSIVRYTIALQDFAPGQIFILDKEYHLDSVAGKIIQWSDHRLWHTAMNSSYQPNWMLHILGYE
jgi:hypothetical protein